MNISIRLKFTLILILFFIIILALSVLSAIQLGRLSHKTSAILRENHVSVVYAREMSQALTLINQEITQCYIIKKYPDQNIIGESFGLFDKSLQLEKNNLTEVGEDKLVSSIDSVYRIYRDSLEILGGNQVSVQRILFLQENFTDLNQKLVHLSQLNVNAIELKTNNAKISAKNALLQMTVLATLCFIIALVLIYSFNSYFTERFFQLHNGIKEIVKSNYGQRLHFEGRDEFYEIALIFNEMAEKLNKSKHELPLIVREGNEKEIILKDLDELEGIIARLKIIEEQAGRFISKYRMQKD
jgi:two-component system, NtrC family, sensor histidine kinase KinB